MVQYSIISNPKQQYVIKGTILNVCNHERPSEPNSTKWNCIEEYEAVLLCMKLYEKSVKASTASGTGHNAQQQHLHVSLHSAIQHTV